ncbi:MAG: gp16 family protein [Pedobacter sp.]
MAKTYPDHRRAELAKIHIAKKDLGMTDDDYTTMLMAITDKTSAGDITARQRQEVLEHLVSLGFKNDRKRGRPANMERKPSQAEEQVSRAKQLEKIEALLTVGEKPWGYADALAARICKVDRVAWVATVDLYKIITALRKQAKREGWDLSGEE